MLLQKTRGQKTRKAKIGRTTLLLLVAALTIVTVALLLTACSGGIASSTAGSTGSDGVPATGETTGDANAATEALASAELAGSDLNDDSSSTKPKKDKSGSEKKSAPTAGGNSSAPAGSSSSPKSASPKPASPKSTTTKPKAPAPSKKDKPAQQAPQAQTITVTVAVDCKTAHAKDPAAVAGLSNAGVILAAKQFTLAKDATVRQALDATGLRVNAAFGGGYIVGIAGLSEFDLGPGSGWVYSVNGVFSSQASTSYRLKEGDSVAWRYTCNQGEDVGARQR